MLSTARSEAIHHDSRPAAAGRDPHPSARAAAALRLDRAPRPAAPDLPAAHQPPGGARLGGEPARLGRGAAGATPNRASRSCPARHSRSKAATSGSMAGAAARRTVSLARRRAGLRRAARGLCPADRDLPARAAPATLCRRNGRVAARRAGVSVKRVSIGDADTRWGSCSASGSIRYNWRLILAPPDVRRWVVAHEVAHRLHMNHGPAFKALEAELFDGDVAAARSLLRRLGPRLKRVGRRV